MIGSVVEGRRSVCDGILMVSGSVLVRRSEDSKDMGVSASSKHERYGRIREKGVLRIGEGRAGRRSVTQRVISRRWSRRWETSRR